MFVLDLLLLVLPIGLLLLGLAAGGANRARHDRAMDEREKMVAHLRLTDLRRMVDATPQREPARLVIAEVTLGTDYFSRFLSGLINLFGGRIGIYERILMQARRECMLQLLEQAHAAGYNAVANVRMEFADIGGNAAQRTGAAMVSILASGTAYHAQTQAADPVGSLGPMSG